MKKIYYLLLIVLLQSVAVKAQSGWVSKSLDNRVSVKFPAEPEKVTKNNVDSYTYKAKDSVKYSANVIDLKAAAGLDSAALAPMKDSQEFADQIVKGMSSSMSKYTFGNVLVGSWKNYATYNVTATDNATKGILNIQMILIGSKIYSLSCLVPANVNTKNKDLFFSSVETK